MKLGNLTFKVSQSFASTTAKIEIMDIEVLKETKMPLLGRKQVSLNVVSLKQPTPSKAELAKAISSKLKVDENLLSLKKYEVYNKKPKKAQAEGK